MYSHGMLYLHYKKTFLNICIVKEANSVTFTIRGCWKTLPFSVLELWGASQNEGQKWDFWIFEVLMKSIIGHSLMKMYKDLFKIGLFQQPLLVNTMNWIECALIWYSAIKGSKKKNPAAKVVSSGVQGIKKNSSILKNV